MDMQTFLRLVLPGEGLYAYLALGQNFKKQNHVETIEDLCSALQSYNEKGYDTYFGCASYRDGSSRSQSNVRAVRAFWLDLDCGEGKPYSSLAAGASALRLFLESAGLPNPFTICSGYGLHAWWPLDKELPESLWKIHANGLHKLCEKHGLQVDPKRTRDSASILRAPDTLNYKNNTTAKVYLAGEGVISSTEAFCKILSGDSLVEMRSGERDNYSLQTGFPDGQRTIALESRIGHLYGIGKKPEEVLEKIRTWNKLNTPPLGDDKLTHTVAGMWNTHTRNHPPAPAPAERTLPKLPWGFEWNDKNEIMIEVDEGEEGEYVKMRITSRPIYLAGVTKKEHLTETALIFNHFLPNEGWKEFMVASKDFHSSNWISVLANEGAGSGCIIEPKLFKMFIGVQIEQFEKEQVTMVRYEQFGWKNDKQDFLIGKTLYSAGGATQVPVALDIEPIADAFTVAEESTLADWRIEANKLLSEDLYPMGVGLVCSFAAPILGLCLNPSDGGIILHLWGETGRGKSKIIEAVDSVWGAHGRTICTASDTQNALFKRISILNNIPAQIDEFNQSLDPEMIAQIVKRFTVGRDKSRLNQKGDMVLKENTFQTLLITTANRSLLTLVGKTNDDGAYARIVEVFVDTRDGDLFKRSESITKSMARHGGVAAQTFIRALVREDVRTAIQHKYQDAVLRYNDGGPEMRFVNRLLAAVELASKLLNGLGILQFDAEKLVTWIAAKARDRENIGVDYADSLGRFISENAHECLAMAGNNMLNPVAPRNVNIRYDKMHNWLTTPVTFIKWWCINNNVDYKTLKGYLEANGAFCGDVTISLTSGTSLTSGKRRCWRIDSSRFITSEAILEIVKDKEKTKP